MIWRIRCITFGPSTGSSVPTAMNDCPRIRWPTTWRPALRRPHRRRPRSSAPAREPTSAGHVARVREGGLIRGDLLVGQARFRTTHQLTHMELRIVGHIVTPGKEAVGGFGPHAQSRVHDQKPLHQIGVRHRQRQSEQSAPVLNYEGDPLQPQRIHEAEHRGVVEIPREVGVVHGLSLRPKPNQSGATTRIPASTKPGSSCGTGSSTSVRRAGTAQPRRPAAPRRRTPCAVRRDPRSSAPSGNREVGETVVGVRRMSTHVTLPRFWKTPKAIADPTGAACDCAEARVPRPWE